MATTSSRVPAAAGGAAGKARASQGGNRHNGRYDHKAKLVAGVTILGCAAALAFGGLKPAENTTSQARLTTRPANTALAQTLAGNGYLEYSTGESSVVAVSASGAANVALARTLAGAGFLESQPGESPIIGTRASGATSGIGFREFLDGEGAIAPLPLSIHDTAPLFGPQP